MRRSRKLERASARGKRQRKDLTIAGRAASLGAMPPRERYLFVCTNRREPGHPKGSCAEKGSEAVVAKLKEELAKRGLARRVRACASSCLDLCEVGISIVDEPGHVVYGGVTEGDVAEIADAVAQGEIVRRLVVVPSDPSPPRTPKGKDEPAG
jgi:(2Fe-2S) ferredoxin